MRNSLISAALALCLLVTAAQAAELSISGLVALPVRLTMEELRKLPPTRVSVTQISNRAAAVPLTCEGPTLSQALTTARLVLSDVKNASLRHTLLVTAGDGYAIALSLGEIDPHYGNAAPLLATECNGQALDAPRLVIPKDIGASRSIHGIVSIQVR